MTSITAEAGDYDHAKNTIKLLGAVAASSPNGHFLHMTDADIDFAAGSLVSENPVTIGYGESRVTGDRFSVSDGGKVVVVEGDVHTLLMPPKSESSTAPRKE